MIQTTLRVIPSRNVRDIYLNRRYRVEARFPGGRTITVAKTQTRDRAFRAARRAALPQTSPTAGGLSYTTDAEARTSAGTTWRRTRGEAGVSMP